ncbi:amino acid permease-like protein [Fistulina hepatica ATCC 64428]|uniref:Amino acid permease-like protein n=1 Tax=Fistulina hepatica ATCC 64428 TaxID=1128425 RepID=A0A0D7AC99_9AGAR|nr:amino acid permease-like protein [Fistulina hepatica ATCC 64428]
MSTHSSDVKEAVAEKSPHDVERLPVEGEEDDIVEFEEKKDLKRGLKQRHIQMIALAGTIGTGLFLGSGKAIAEGGPAGALMGYTFVGCLVSCVCISIAEMAALVPLSGAIVRHAEYFFDPALSFAQGWNTIYGSMVGLPAEITATAVLMEFWVSVNSAVWITVFGLCLFASNLCLVKIYGELEFSFAMLKIILIVGLILMGIIVSAGGGPDGTVYGFKYWHDPGPFVQYLSIKGSLGRFCGFWTTFSNAAYAYSGVEGIPTAAAETRNPRRNIPKAAKRIFIRVAIFYIVSIFVVTLLVASNDPDLLKSTGTAAESPFVIAATNAGIPVIPHIVNAVVLTSAWSSGNSGMLGGSRSLYGIAREGHAPKVFLRVNRFGIPYVAVCFIGVFVSLGYLSCGSDSAAEVFGWLQDLVSAATFVNWIIICLVYLRFYYGLRAQGIDRKELPWAAPFQPYAAWIGLISFSILFLTAGFAVFIHDEWDTEVFFSAYFNMPLIFALYFGYKIVKRTKLVRYEDMPFQHFLQLARDNPEPRETPLKGWNKLQILWS